MYEREFERLVVGTRGEVVVGERVRQLRQSIGLSVRTLATRTGFSPSFISQVEHGLASPSIASLERIATELGISLVEFFDVASPVDSATVRSGGEPHLISSWSRAELRALGPIGPEHALEPVMITLEPGGRSGKHPAAHAGEEFAIVFEGEVTLTLGDRDHHLRRGDSATFSSATPHRWENSGTVPARIVVVAHRAI